MNKKIKFRVECFEGYQLNKHRNFITAPMCECGCGQKAMLELKSNDDLFDTCVMLLKEHDCPNSAIFVLAYDDSMYAVINVSEIEDQVDIIARENFERNFFAEIDADFRLCCYGLLVETSPGYWKIIED